MAASASMWVIAGGIDLSTGRRRPPTSSCLGGRAANAAYAATISGFYRRTVSPSEALAEDRTRGVTVNLRKLIVILAVLALLAAAGVAAAVAGSTGSAAAITTTATATTACTGEQGEQGEDEEENAATEVENAAAQVIQEALREQADDQSGDDDQGDEQGEDAGCDD